MALVQFGSVQFDADLVVFDKDGTLIEFERMWGRLALAWVEELTADLGETTEGDLAQEFHRSWGFDLQERQTAPQSPLAIASTAQLQTIAANVLYRHGLSWPEAEDRTRSVFRQVAAGLPLADLVRPAGDVAGLLGQLQEAGVRVAVVTTDHRAETEQTLRILAIDHLVDRLVCSDDGLPSKPAPDMLLSACEHLGADPARAAVVGDTMADLLMSKRAGVGLIVAVRTGPGDPALLATHASVVIDSIDDISIPAIHV